MGNDPLTASRPKVHRILQPCTKRLEAAHARYDPWPDGQARSRGEANRKEGCIAPALIGSSGCKELGPSIPRSLLKIQVRLQIKHHSAKLSKAQRLVPIAEGLFWARMH